ncbi:hypothetical protein LTR35_009472 [Friedmanniomyces endolithicus]|nr:hypothetical protein LTR35_009472 [Friedmanniomyces endolithicus]KAK0290813.1 hypothetical protein LTS00_008590 [Friedmanniomyces endolithicus]KAK0997906.1 hypothetical protein LTR54_009704 [Friedmanniomyces endolithicus]
MVLIDLEDTGTKKQPCYHWLMGSCEYGDECRNGPHPANLDGRLQGTKGSMVHEVTKGHQACQRCLTRFYDCDKVYRAEGSEDPCSECRHFGGPGCNCKLNDRSNYNDHAWRIMLQRGNHDYTLPAAKPRNEGTSGKPLPSEMLEREVKAGWTGESKESLLTAVDFLPSGVRDCPRAYLVPATETKKEKKNVAFKERLTATPAASSASSPAQSISAAGSKVILAARPNPIPAANSQSIPAKRKFASAVDAWPTAPSSGAPMERPPAHPLHGKVKTCLCDFDDGQWTMEYEDGATITTRLNERPAKMRKAAKEAVVLEPPQVSVSDRSGGHKPLVIRTVVDAPIARSGEVEMTAKDDERTPGHDDMVVNVDEDSDFCKE